MKKFSPWGILVLADIGLWVKSFHAVVFGQGKNILFKSMLGRCEKSRVPKRGKIQYVSISKKN